MAASLERYSKHPLASAMLDAARERKLPLNDATSISEPPGRGLRGTVSGHEVYITGRKGLTEVDPNSAARLPAQSGGSRNVWSSSMVDMLPHYAFMTSLGMRANRSSPIFGPNMISAESCWCPVTGKAKCAILASLVGIQEIHASQTPEQKLEIVRREMARDPTVFLGDGINDAPALTAATVGIAIGQNSDVTAEAADAVILDSSLESIDEFLHIGQRMRRIACKAPSAAWRMSIGGMFIAAAGYLPPVAGAIIQEVIDVGVVFNALRMAIPPGRLTDF